MEESLDTGNIIHAASIPIEETDTLGTLSDKLSILGADLLKKVLPKIQEGENFDIPQRDEDATYVTKLTREDETLDFNKFFVESYYSIDGTYSANGARISGFDVYNILVKIDDINNNPNRFYDIDISASNMTKVTRIRNIINKYKSSTAVNHEQIMKGRKLDDADKAVLESTNYYYKYEISNSGGYVRKISIN